MDRTPSQAPSRSLGRRLPLAVLIALSVALIGGGAIGFATAAGEATTFQVPAPMGGDKAVYDIAPSDAEWDRQARIEVRAPEPLMLEDGSWASVTLMRAGADAAYFSFGVGSSQVEFSMVGWSGAYVDTATGDVVATLISSGSGSTSSSSGGASLLPVAALGGESQGKVSTDMTLAFTPGEIPCGVRSGLQDGPVQEGDLVKMTGCGGPTGCHTDGVSCFTGENPTGGDQFRVVGMRQLEGQDALLLASDDLEMRLWYQAGVPYPIQFDYKVGSEDEVHWRMTGFTRGTEPLVPGPLPAPVTPAAIEQAPVGATGPALAGFDHAYPIEAALQYAIDNSQKVDDFVTTHPDWFMSHAGYSEEDQDGNITGAWSLSLRSGTDELHVLVQTPSDAPTSLPPALAKTLGSLEEMAGMPGDNNGVYVFEGDSSEPAWPDACRPTTLPTIGSLAQRWGQMEQRDPAEANAYGFDLWCWQDDDGVDAGYAVTVGDARVIQPPSSNRGPLDEPESVNATSVLRMLMVLDSGAVAVHTSETAIQRNSWGAFGSPQDQGNGIDIERAGTGAWATPSGPVAASITLLSILAGLAYWLWPTLKAGPLALFSRLQGPELLDHPVRRELLQRIEAHPGVHYQDLVRAMGKGKGAIEHHLRKLQDAGMVKAIAAGGYTCWFPTKYDHRLVGAAPALKSDGARAVLAAVQAHPGTSARDIGTATGLGAAAVHHHLQRLSAAGLVSIVRAGRSLSILPTDLAGQVGPGTAAGAA